MSDKAATPEKYIEFSIQNRMISKKSLRACLRRTDFRGADCRRKPFDEKKSAMGKKSCDVQDAALQLLLKTVPYQMEKRNFHARNARVNLLKIMKESGSLMMNGI